MALLMPDINLRRAKRHLERYWRQVLGAGERTGERKRLIFRSKSVAQAKAPQTVAGSAKAAPPIQNLERDPKREAVTGGNDSGAGGSVEPNAQLDCESLPAAKTNQETADGELDRNQATIELTVAESAAVSHQELKAEPELAPASTSTTETSSSVSSAVTTLSSTSTTVCVGKPPLSRVGPQVSHDNRSSHYSPRNMPQPKYISRAKGPTLGSILQRIHLNDGDVSELDFSTLAQRSKRLESEGNNLITDRGAKALAQAIRCNCTLKSLELVNNRITRVGAVALLDALDVNLYVETIDLDENNVPTFVESQLAAAFARNRAQALILESHAAEKKAVKIVRRASGFDTQDEDEDSSEVDEEEWEGWEDDDGDSVSSGFLTCSNVTDIPLSSSGLWI
ncbi:myosin-like protein [Phytophthora cinnamomi]|uniref:myosin-like protein n=1 Tax=Phytophthora cinnamomi TaxID=4785 RepID=UPI00355A550D|nr:myosin-like protein [Phytophthora cinnamomi]